MHGHDVRPGVCYPRNMQVGVVQHHVNINGQLCHAIHRLQHWLPEADVRHKASVHHVEVYLVNPGSLNGGHGVGEVSEVCAEEGCGYLGLGHEEVGVRGAARVCVSDSTNADGGCVCDGSAPVATARAWDAPRRRGGS